MVYYRVMKLTHYTGKIIGFSILAIFLVTNITLMGLDYVIIPGDKAATQQNIETYPSEFWTAVAGYFFILALNILVSLCWYTMLAGSGKKRAFFAAASRLAYTAVALVSLIALSFYHSVFYEKGMSISYLFFILHLLFLGLATLKVKGIPRFFGILLIVIGIFFIVAVPCYTILTYGYFVLSEDLYWWLSIISMYPGALSEILLGIWLIIKSRRLSEENNG